MIEPVERSPPERFDLLYVGLLPPHPGGAPISCVQLLLSLTAAGHRVRALAPIRAAAAHGTDEFARSSPSVEVTRYVLPYDPVNPSVPLSDELVRQERQHIQALLPRLIAECRPDIILLGRESYALHVPDIAGAYSIPTIMMVRGGTTNGILGGGYPSEIAAEYLAGFRKVDRIVCVAEHFVSGLKRLGFHDVEVIPNAADTEHFRPTPKDKGWLQELRLSEDDWIVLLPAVLKPVKRPLDLLGCAELLKESATAVRYVVAGDGPILGHLEDECDRRGISHLFRFPGWVDHARMPSLYSIADAVALPSESEGLARVYLEGQASARLLIASDIPAAREVICDRVTGLLFPVSDVKRLAVLVLEAVEDQTLGETIGQRARRAVMKRTSQKALVDYVHLMESLIASRLDLHPT